MAPREERPIENFAPIIAFHVEATAKGEIPKGKLRQTLDWIYEQDPEAAADFLRIGMTRNDPEVAITFSTLIPRLVARDFRRGYAVVEDLAESSQASPFPEGVTDIRLEMAFLAARKDPTGQEWREMASIVSTLPDDENISGATRRRIEDAFDDVDEN